MSEQLKQQPPISHSAILFAGQQLGVDTNELTIEPVSGGFSLNQRAIVRCGNKSLFVKEVEDTLLEGDGKQERAWLAKDQGVMELLRSEDIDVVPEWSVLSDDSTVLAMTAYPTVEGWYWTLPDDTSVQRSYISAVITAAKTLETATFTSRDVDNLSLHPYFREKIGDVDSFSNFVADRDNLDRLVHKYQLLEQTTKEQLHSMKLQSILDALHNPAAITNIRRGIQDLLAQPDEVFGHCDVRSDNLAYNLKHNRVVLVDWNWASQTPKKFGSTEFLISVAKQGADITEWHNELNPGLLAGLVGFWWGCCLRPEFNEGSNLRNHQAVSAAVAYDLLTKIS